MKVWMKGWPEDSYITLTRVEFSEPSKGKAWGKGVWKGKDKGEFEVLDSFKRDIWQFEPPEDLQINATNKY